MDRQLTLPKVTSLNAVCPWSSAILKTLSGGCLYATQLFVEAVGACVSGIDVHVLLGILCALVYRLVRDPM